MSRTWVVARFLAGSVSVIVGHCAPGRGFTLPIAFSTAWISPVLHGGRPRTGAICLLTALLLAARANHAWFYPLLARLPQRREHWRPSSQQHGHHRRPGAVDHVANLAAGRLSLQLPSALWLLPTWFALWLLANPGPAPGSTHEPRRVAPAAVGRVRLLLVANDRKSSLDPGLEWATAC
jgi:hypothetical protein